MAQHWGLIVFSDLNAACSCNFWGGSPVFCTRYLTRAARKIFVRCMLSARSADKNLWQRRVIRFSARHLARPAGRKFRRRLLFDCCLTADQVAAIQYLKKHVEISSWNIKLEYQTGKPNCFAACFPLLVAGLQRGWRPHCRFQ